MEESKVTSNELHFEVTTCKTWKAFQEPSNERVLRQVKSILWTKKPEQCASILLQHTDTFLWLGLYPQYLLGKFRYFIFDAVKLSTILNLLDL